ncbi:helix-turn-helix transcriptional regulator [Dysgonomonas sp. Marseille-P4677]|uniref:helix-turn-helix domain-containing protein n=1 Tax=Dysgonomonas sp. Marseille-P4677 TaxID=2364790 RepID=UPI001912D76A|nr:helix-turn-helix transcriptional regulator [Dysgonomonas sp. Marseille-P4677]MBK5722381.1 helix-turn-helix transcriptional regulator [Dysgonomonas sp. Marseille-P4677]
MIKLRVKELLREKGITQKELADKMNITEVGLSKSLTGNPTTTTLERIADALNVDFLELFAPQSKGINGYIEYNGIIRKVSSKSDIEKILHEIKE